MRAIKLITIMLVLAVTGCASNDMHNEAHNRPDMTIGQNFVRMVASSDQFEIMSSKMALSRTRDANVKRVAKRMIADHTTSSRKMAALLHADGMPQPSASLLPHHQRALDALRNESDFDDDYLEAQDVAHRQAIRLFQDYSQRGDNADLRDFAAKTLPTLYKHHHMIEKARGTDHED